MVHLRPYHRAALLILLATLATTFGEVSSISQGNAETTDRSPEVVKDRQSADGSHHRKEQLLPQRINSDDDDAYQINDVESTFPWPPWPWHHKNHTAKNNTDPDDTPSPSPAPTPKPTPQHKNKTDTSCYSHKSCNECASSSWGCHWCAHDEACHPIGSIHGCISGVNCYSEDRCTRKEPQPLKGYDWDDVGPVALIVILSVAGLLLCCATCCLGVACCMRASYEDYATLAVANAGDSIWVGQEINASVDSRNDPRKRTVVFQSNDDVGDTAAATGTIEAADNNINSNEEQDGTEYQRLLSEGENDGVDDEESLHTRITQARSQALSKSSNTKCMFNACAICYVVTVLVIGALTIFGFLYAPRKPDINVCADAVAWKSIVDGMTSLKMQASFQILMSVENPNRLDVVLDMASGSFNHDGAQVGTFDVPQTKIESMAITDILVSVTFTPDKWEALSLTTEYYKGTLSFLVDMQAAIKIPAAFNYTSSFEIDKYKVLVNDPKMMDKHLCKCAEKTTF